MATKRTLFWKKEDQQGKGQEGHHQMANIQGLCCYDTHVTEDNTCMNNIGLAALQGIFPF